MLPALWHARVIRIVIWMEYCCWRTDTETSQTDSLLPRTLHTIRSTAWDAYWGTKGSPALEGDLALDDEMLCYDALSRTCAMSSLAESDPAAPTSFVTGWNGLLFEFCKRGSVSSTVDVSSSSYPLWHLGLQLASHIRREEYFYAWQSDRFSSQLPILAKCILSPALCAWRYRTVQQYNVSFAKGECVSDLDRLLGLEPNQWSLNYARAFGLPTHVDEEGCTVLTMKQVAMPDLSHRPLDNIRCTRTMRDCDQGWVYGEQFEEKEQMGIRPPIVRQLLQSGQVKNQETNNNPNNSSAKANVSSLLQAMSALASDSSQHDGNDGARGTTSKLGPARSRKTGGAKCKFFAKGSCRYGDNCRFAHSSLK
jgi:CCCH-type zinc finger